MSKYVIRKIKIDGELVDLYAQAVADDVVFSINKGNNLYEESTVQAVLEQVGIDIKQIKEDMEFISGGGSNVIQPINFGGTGATNTVQAALNLQTLYLGSIPYGVEAMAFVTEETIDSLLTPGTYRYINSDDIGSVTINIQPMNIFTNIAIGSPFQESVSAYSTVNVIVTEDSYTVEGFVLVEDISLVVNVFSDDITIKVPYRKVTDLTYTVKWFVETGLGTGKYELLTQVTRGGSGYDEGDVVTVTDTDKVIEGYYTFDADNTNNVLSTTLAGDTDNVLKLYFNAVPEPVYTGYTIKIFNAATGEELIGTFTTTLISDDNTETTVSITYPQVELNSVIVGTSITINPRLTINSATRTYNYDSDDERNVTTLTLVEDNSSNIFKLYYAMVPVYANITVKFFNAATGEELIGTFQKCRIYDYTSVPTSLGNITVPVTFSSEVDTTIYADAYEVDLFNPTDNKGYIYGISNSNNVTSLIVSETEPNILKLYYTEVNITVPIPYVEYTVKWVTESGTLLPINLKNPNPDTRLAMAGSMVGLTETDKAAINNIEPLSYSDDATLTEGGTPVVLSVIFPDSIIPSELEEETEIASYSLYSMPEISDIDLASSMSGTDPLMPSEGTLYVLNANISGTITQIFIGNYIDENAMLSDTATFGILIRNTVSATNLLFNNWNTIYPVQEGGLSEVTPDDFTGILPVIKGGTGASDLSKFALLDDKIVIPNNADLNNYKDVGSYYTAGHSNTILNRPFDGELLLHVFTSRGESNRYISQTCVRTINGMIAYRWVDLQSDSWSGWQMTYSSANKPDSLTDGTKTYKIGQDPDGVYIEIT